MVSPSLYCSESLRLAALYRYEILDTPSEDEFDGLTRLASHICETPIAAINLVDCDRQWFKSEVGLGIRETSLDVSICKNAILQKGLFVVPDTTLDPRFQNNPLVVDRPNLRFYAGALLESSDGLPIGTLCVLDYQSRDLTEAQRQALLTLARQVMALLELRLSCRRLGSTLESIDGAFFALDYDFRFTHLNAQVERVMGLSRQHSLGRVMWDVDGLGSDSLFAEQCRLAALERHSLSFETFYNPAEVWLDVRIHPSLEGLTVYLQDITARKQSEAKIQRLNRLYSVSSGINEAIVRIQHTQELYEQACRIAVERGGLVMAWAGVAELDGRLRAVARWGKDEGYLDSITVSCDPEVPSGKGPGGQAFRTKKPAYENDIAGSSGVFASKDEALHRGYRSCAAFPLQLDGQPLGVFVVYSEQVGYFDTEELHLLNSLAENLSFAIESHQRERSRRHAEEMLKVRVRQQEIIAKLAIEATKATCIDAIFAIAASLVAEGVGVELCKILQLLPDGRNLRVVAGVGWRTGLVGEATVKVEGESQAGFTLKSTGPIYVNDLRQETRFKAPALLTEHNVVSGMSVTIEVQGRAWGGLGAHSRSVRAFSDDDTHFMQSVAALLSVSIERVDRQRVLAESNRRMENAQRVARMGSWELNTGSRQFTCSAEIYRIFGIENSCFAPTDERFFLTFVHPDDRGRVLEAQTGGAIVEVDHRIVRPDGEIRHVRQRSENIYDAPGNVVCVSGTFLDITERKRREQIQQWEARVLEDISLDRPLKEILENIVLGVEGIIPGAIASIVLIAPDGKHLRHGAAPSLPDSYNQVIEGVAIGHGVGSCGTAAYYGKPIIVEDTESDPLWEGYRELARKHGLRACWSMPVIDGRGNVLASFAIYHLERRLPQGEDLDLIDRTARVASIALERDRKEKELRASEERFRKIFQDAATGIAIVTPDGRLIEANNAYCRMLGYTEDELRQLTIESLTHPDDWPRNAELLRELVEHSRESFVYEKRLLAKSGSLVWTRLSVSAQNDATGRPVRIIGVVEDITDYKRVEQEKQELLLREQAARREADAASLYYRSLFESAPGCYLVLTSSDFKIVAVSDAYLRTTMTRRDQIYGKHIFEIFPNDPNDPASNGVEKLRASLDRVKLTRQTDVMTVQRYPVRRPKSQGGGFEERYWSPVNSPVPGLDGELEFIIHRVEDVTEYIRLKKKAGEEDYREWALDSRAQQMEADIILRSFELERANEELARSQALLRIAGRAARVGAWQISVPDYKIVWSEETCRIHDEPAGIQPALDDWMGFYAPGHRVLMQRAIESCIEKGSHFDFEAPITTSKNRRVWVRSIGEAVRDEDGTIIRLQGAIQDISERKQADETLRESEERFRILSKVTNDAIWDWDLATGRLCWNEGYEHLFGFQRASVDPSIKSWTDYIHPDDLDRVWRGIHAVIDGGGVEWEDEYQFVNRKGDCIFVLDRGYVIRDISGKAVRMIGGMTDVTNWKRAERKLQEQAALLDKARDAILVRDLNHHVLYWNNSAERLYGWSGAEVLRRSAKEFLYVDCEAFLEATEATLTKGEWMGELEQVTKDARRIVVEGRWTLVRDEIGQPISILAINTDITERKQLERQFLRAQRMESIGTLAGGIAHDLNNVLSPIMMSIGILRSTVTDRQSLEILEVIATSAQRGADMVQQVLSFARGVEGRHIDVVLKRLIGDVTKMVAETFPKNIRIEKCLCPDLWNVKADPTQLHQVFLNLCVNARDAMPGGGKITITAENVSVDEQYAAMNIESQVGEYVKITVEDTGTGIPREIIDRIFDPFFTTKDVGKGTGLGLSTSLAILQSHRGFVRVDSKEGEGTCFEIYLPAEMKDTPCDEVATVDLPRGNGETVLVVDDEPSIRQITKQTLELFGYSVLLAADGSEAISLYVAHQTEIAVVLTDMMMPVLDGPATIRVLLRINPKVRIIGASGVSSHRKLAESIDCCMHCFLLKPYTAETLLKAIKKVVTS